MKLNGKVAIVTGASSGMGHAISLLFAQEGATVIAVARRLERLEELKTKVEADKFAGKIIPLKGDVSSRHDIEHMIDFAESECKKLDILVNNAGVMDNFEMAEDVTDEIWENVININLTAPMAAIRKAIPLMKKNESGGVILNIASVGGLFGGKAGAAYTVSKHGVIGLTKNVGYTYSDEKIRCNAICPGAIATEIGSHIHANPRGQAKVADGMKTMHGGAGTAEDIANAALFLVSDDSKFVTGTTLVVDGGWTSC
ncbi:3-beta-hydroxycholanate 3-dehydrogenase (NAD(+)) 2 [Methanosarcinaceae archaeon Ag5]|uniref:3-beta-hydroxycholanate 3-dehydrogenase (NAD(+)) 2 n=1 Tax=Methanolapillus africanus TaxID=3028297 RepID=A0AAE4MKT8_9EURY|nr:3-beta-hydroxycholanate 3-dehydrogenase (NAD(+)) 2 [Methanosarcinaceae archaeon Ag5]